MPTTQDLRNEAARCSSANAAAILLSVANWLDDLPATIPYMPPHKFADLWCPASPVQTAVQVCKSYAEREPYACDVCGNVPDEYGMITHGRGCFVASEDGGGETYVEF